MSAPKKPKAASKAARSSKTAKRPPKKRQPATQGHACTEPGCTKVCKSAGGLAAHRRAAHRVESTPETPTAAVERALRSISITPKRAVLAATVRELAKALEQCEPTDKAKTAKELTARMNDLLGDGPADPDKPDWTEGAEE